MLSTRRYNSYVLLEVATVGGEAKDRAAIYAIAAILHVVIQSVHG